MRPGRRSLVAFGVIVVFALFGQQLLTYMHISLPALQASGGLLLLLVAMELLTGKMEEPTPSATAAVNVAIVPLGTPLLAGPGAIVASMVFVQQAHDVPRLGRARGCASWACTSASTWRCGSPGVIHGSCATAGPRWSSRIAGLLLAAIAVQMVADAVRAFITG